VGGGRPGARRDSGIDDRIGYGSAGGGGEIAPIWFDQI